MVKGAPKIEKKSLRRGKWSPEEDQKLKDYIKRYGIWNWSHMPTPAGLMRSGKSCRLRWMNYLKPGIKFGNFTQIEEQTIIKLHQQLGNRWSTIAARLPGRTDNEIKNYWHTHLKKSYNYLKEQPTTSFNFLFQGTQTTSTEAKSQNGLLLHAADSFSSSSSSSEISTGVVDGLHKNMPSTSTIIEENITDHSFSETYGFADLESLLMEQSFSMEGLYMVGGTYDKYKTYNEDDYNMVSSTPQWGHQEHINYGDDSLAYFFMQPTEDEYSILF